MVLRLLDTWAELFGEHSFVAYSGLLEVENYEGLLISSCVRFVEGERGQSLEAMC